MLYDEMLCGGSHSSLFWTSTARAMIETKGTGTFYHKKNKEDDSSKVNDRGTRVPSLPLLWWRSMVLSSSG
jgi:hypothetical protein